MEKFDTKTVASVQKFVDLIDERKTKAEADGNSVDFLFRGQRRDLPLTPKLAR